MGGRDWDRLRGALAVFVPVVAACSERAIDEEQFTANLCDRTGLHALMAVEPAVPVDASELRAAEEQWDDETDEHVLVPSVMDADGVLCSGADEGPTCRATVDELPLHSSIVESDFTTVHRSLVFTRGDEVGGAWDLEQLRVYLGEIDSPGDALLLAVLSGHQPICDDGDEVGQRGDSWNVFTQSGGGCGEGDDIYHHVVRVGPGGSVEVVETEHIEDPDADCAAGRVPAGLCVRRGARRSGSAVGRYLADMARLEAASIVAFEQLAVELVLHRAPRSLVRGALSARADEVRHARITARLARRHGAIAVRPVVEPQASRSLLAFAVDNAQEGCVRETYGAATAAHAALASTDPVIRRAMVGIARDETRHAALSWSIAAWLDTRLDARARNHVARRRADAVDRLDAELAADLAPSVHAVAGLPQSRHARALLHRVHRSMA